MSNYSDDISKKKGYDDDYYHCSPMESCVPLIHGNEEVIVASNMSSRHEYPGNRRVPSHMASPPPGNVLIRTAGNALQAIPATILEEKQQQQQQSSQLIEVQVPPNTGPGDTIHVRSPYTTSNEEVLIAATIPDGVYPGQTFYVQCPTNTSSNPVELTTVAVLATKEEEAPRSWW